MIYTFTRSLMNLALTGFFHDIRIIGKKHLLTDRPTIFIANHPSALLDPLVVAVRLPRKFHFIAAAEYFGKGVQKWILKNEFNMIPVYRPQNYKDQKVDNDHMFKECYEHLSHNGAILIFPEGTSESENRVRPLKTGTARILAGFKKAFPDQEVYVQSLGINYTFIQKFRTSVLLKIGEPIKIDEIDHEEDSPRSITGWTKKLEEDLRSQVLHRLPETENLIEKVNRVFLKQLESKLENVRSGTERFLLRKNIIEAVNHFHKKDPSSTELVERKLDEFLVESRKLKIPPYIMRKSWTYQDLAYLILSGPFAMLGLLLNGIPYLFVRAWFRKKYHPKIGIVGKGGISEAFQGTISFSLGTVIFLLWLIMLSLLVGSFTMWWLGIVTFFSAYFLGLFTISYWIKFMKTQKRIRYQRSLKHSDKLQGLNAKRAEILELLDGYRKEYQKVLEARS